VEEGGNISAETEQREPCDAGLAHWLANSIAASCSGVMAVVESPVAPAAALSMGTTFSTGPMAVKPAQKTWYGIC
jgi:hypothetical protein